MHIDQSGGGASFFKIREEEMKKSVSVTSMMDN